MLAVVGAALLRGEKLLFHDLSFTAADMQAVEVLGTNGSGKSSLLKALAGLLPLEQGVISWRNQEIEQYKAETIYIGHLTALHPTLTAVENLRFLAGLHTGSDDYSVENIKAALAYMQMSAYQNITSGQLSAGQKQRVSLARLLLANCKLWLLDEPFANLDNAGICLVHDIIIQHLSAGGIAVIATHARLSLQGCEVKTLWL